MQLLLREICCVCQKTSAHLLIFRRLLPLFPVNGAYQTVAVLHLHIDWQYLVTAKIIAYLCVRLQCSDCQIAFAAKVYIIIVYREILPHAVHRIVLAKLYDAPLCTEPFYILFIAKMIILILCLSVPYRARGIRDNPAKHEGIILQYFVVYSVLA